MLIVDAQIHLWNAGNTTTPWHRQVPAYLKDDALKEMDAAGVDAAVLTPHTPWDPNANELCIEASRQHPEKFVILGSFPLDKPESRRLVDSWKQRPGMLGLRFTFNEPAQRTWLTDGTVDWLWPAAERARLPIALMAAPFATGSAGSGEGRTLCQRRSRSHASNDVTSRHRADQARDNRPVQVTWKTVRPQSVVTNVPESKDERPVFSNSTNRRCLWQDYL